MVSEIRRYRLEDDAVVAEAVRESINELQPWMPWCHPGYSIEESRSWLQVQVPAFDEGVAFEFAIVSADGHYLGGCGLNQIDRINKRANLGYWVRSSATRRGVATAAVRAIRDWAFDHTDLIRLEIVIVVGNLASHGVAEKAGAVREGTLHRRLVLHGTVHDATMFSLTRP
jgi:ribosomal-protein-serine acetyltransferase